MSRVRVIDRYREAVKWLKITDGESLSDSSR